MPTPDPKQTPHPTRLNPDQLRVILVETQGEANLGAVARTLSCFGVRDWALVRPRVRVAQQARNWACHGQPWLEQVAEFCSLEQALENLDLSVALTGIAGKRRHRLVTPCQFASEVMARCRPERIGLVFGNEESGLNNHDLSICQWRVKIPTDPTHMSLNLAHAVTIMLYELVGRERSTELGGRAQQPAPPELLRRAVSEFGTFMAERGYPGHDATLAEELQKVNDLLYRASPEPWEINFLLGMIRHLRNQERASKTPCD